MAELELHSMELFFLRAGSQDANNGELKSAGPEDEEEDEEDEEDGEGPALAQAGAAGRGRRRGPKSCTDPSYGRRCSGR